MKKRIFAGLAAGVALLTLAACGNGSSTKSGSNSNSTALSGKIVAGGSTALQPLVTQAAQSFMKDNTKVSITVQPGGSGAGLTGVSNGSMQIGNSDIFAEEKTGIDASKIKDNHVAVVGITPIVNSDVSAKVKSLTQQQLSDIFTGKITNWSKVGGPKEAITLIGRTAGSGTRVLFDKYGLNGASELASEATQDSTGAASKAVSTTPGAISYVAFSGLEGVSNISELSLDFGKGVVKPTDAKVENNAWKIWGYEHMYTSTKPTADETAFIKAISSDKYKLLSKNGYIATDTMKGTRSVAGTWKAN